MRTQTLKSNPDWLVYIRDLIRELVVRDMKLRYKRSFLGFAWSLLNPLAQLLVLNFIFRLIMPLKISNYPSFLFIGLLVWGWLQSSLLMSTGAIVDNRELVRRPGFPTQILPFVSVATNFIHFLLALPVLFLFLFLSGIRPTPLIFLLPGLCAIQFILILSLAYAVAALHVTFRDTQYLLGILLLLGFYLSPVFYDSASIPARYQFIYHLNPMVLLIDSYRAILLYGQSPEFFALFWLSLTAGILLWCGYTYFKGAGLRFVEEL